MDWKWVWLVGNLPVSQSSESPRRQTDPPKNHVRIWLAAPRWPSLPRCRDSISLSIRELGGGRPIEKNPVEYLIFDLIWQNPRQKLDIKKPEARQNIGQPSRVRTSILWIPPRALRRVEIEVGRGEKSGWANKKPTKGEGRALEASRHPAAFLSLHLPPGCWKWKSTQ